MTSKEVLQAFKIIKNKGVAVGFIQLLIKEKYGGLVEYNNFIGDNKILQCGIMIEEREVK